MSFRRASDSIRQQFYELFNDQYTASEAYHYHRSRVELETDGDEVAFSDSSRVPSKETVKYWFNCWRQEKFGTNAEAQEKSESVLLNKIETFGAIGNIVKWDPASRTIIIVTPIMQRAHQLRSSSEIVFVDSTSACDERNHVLTFLFTPCAAGAVPIGVCITEGMSTQKYESAFQLLATALGGSAFNGQMYPEIFMTDDSDAEREALRRTWPHSKSLLCLFHVSQSVWRWLWSASNGICHDHRPILMKSFRSVIYAQTDEEAKVRYQSAIESDIGKLYPRWLWYIDTYWKWRELWCLAYRRFSALRGNHTNNYCEASIRLFKDIVLSRTKVFNQIALIDHIVSDMEHYYEQRLMEFAHSRNSSAFLWLDRALKAAGAIDASDIHSVQDGFYYVKSQNTEEYYHVDADNGICSCPVGSFGTFCKHQAALYKQGIQLPNAPPISKMDRYTIAVLAKGKERTQHVDFYADLKVSVA